MTAVPVVPVAGVPVAVEGGCAAHGLLYSEMKQPPYEGTKKKSAASASSVRWGEASSASCNATSAP